MQAKEPGTPGAEVMFKCWSFIGADLKQHDSTTGRRESEFLLQKHEDFIPNQFYRRWPNVQYSEVMG